MQQSDVLLIHAEVEEIVIALVLIAPDEACCFDPALLGDDFELDAHIAVAAGHAIENGEGEFGVAAVSRNLCQDVWAAGRSGVLTDNPMWQVRRTSGSCRPERRHRAR